MCRAKLLFAASMVLCTLSAKAEEPLPYPAYVVTSDANIRSGPGEEFYATSRLIWGSKVEVYHQVNEWCAIRPPESSFSWVLKKNLTPTAQDGVARVIDENTMTRVGTVFGDDHQVEYVRLATNEVVEVLGSKRLAEPSGGTVKEWYKIMPPAGEFRWIHQHHLGSEPPTGERHEEQTAAILPRITDRALDEPNRLPESVIAKPIELAESHLANDDGGVSRQAIGEDRWRERPSAIEEEERDVQPVSVTQTADETQSNSHGDGRWRETNHAFREIKSSLGADELDRLDLALSEVVAEPLSEWSFHDLSGQIQQLIDRSESTHDRDRARELLTKLNEFQDIKRRYDVVANKLETAVPATFTAPQRSKPLQRLARGFKLPKIIGSGVRTAPKASPRAYDGTGWLMPVVTERTGVPRYALTDENGHIVSFVSPATGVNLRHYERRQVGVIGKRGYVPKLNRSHVTAERVVMLDRHRR